MTIELRLDRTATLAQKCPVHKRMTPVTTEITPRMERLP